MRHGGRCSRPRATAPEAPSARRSRRRNGFRQTGRKTFDLRVSRQFNLGGRARLVALAEAFNVFNTVNYTGFSTIKYRVATSSYDPAANRVTMNLVEDAGFAGRGRRRRATRRLGPARHANQDSNCSGRILPAGSEDPALHPCAAGSEDLGPHPCAAGSEETRPYILVRPGL